MNVIVRPLLCALVASSSVATAQDWTRPVIVPLPHSVRGVKTPVVSLNGTWKFTLEPPADFWRGSVDPSGWSDVTVPGEPWMQGYKIERDREYPYKKQIAIPADFAGQRVLLRFDGVYSVGRVWVNGTFAGEHYGGFTSWNLDITDLVEPGTPAWLTVGISDLTHDPSFASGYASRYLGVNDVPHHIGGILRDVSLVAVPPVHITRLHVATDLDADYLDATLEIACALENVPGSGPADGVGVRINLLDAGGTPVHSAELSPPILNHKVRIQNPLKWDAEHPNLYTLRAEVVIADQVVETLARKIGFREIEVVGPELRVNGKRVKLRGGCRHSVHPLAGRAYVPGLAEKDVRLYKEANVNYIRTSHYPTSERFLELCDEYGIYVEEEAAICWLDHHAARGKLDDIRDDPEVLTYMLRAASEMVERDRSHPAIIMWSLGNENVKWGTNFEAERDYLRKEDPTRPLKTGHNYYGGGWNTSEHTDIDSYHYPGWNSNFDTAGGGKPFLGDEYAHVICYYGKGSFADRDPNVRNFWGESLKRFWDAMYPSKGTLGAAIWGTVDEVFQTPDRCLGYGRWGIFDGWRRKKPEYWHTKKAYSPIRIVNKPLGNPGVGKPLRIPVANWFDHTDFSELKIVWRVGQDSGEVAVALAAGGTQGEVVVPARAWADSDTVALTFARGDEVIDEFLLRFETMPVPYPQPSEPAPTLSTSDTQVVVSGKSFSLAFDRKTGQVVRGVSKGEPVLIGGPVLNLTPMSLPALSVETFQAERLDRAVHLLIKGAHGTIGVAYDMLVDGDGGIELTYAVSNPPAGKRISDEVGVAFVVPDRMDRVAWERDGLWSVYPQGHIGRNSGVAVRMRPGPEWQYRQEPSWPWEMDMKDFHQHGIDHAGYGMTHDFRAAKEYIHWAEVFEEGGRGRLRVESDGRTHAVRMGLALPRHAWVADDRDAAVVLSGTWTPYADDGDLQGTELYSDNVGSAVDFRFEGTSVAWIGAKNHNLGKADVYLDGKLAEADVDAYAPSKQHQCVLFSRTGLAVGEHTLRVVVKGTKNAESSAAYVLIDGFSDVTSGMLPLQLNINREWTYELGWGNYGRTAKLTNGFSDTVRLRL